MRKTIIGPLLLATIMIWVSCLDEFDFDIPSGELQSVVIQGKLQIGNPSIATVQVSDVFSFDASISTGVNVQRVLLQDESGSSLELSKVGTGLYRIEIPQSSDFKVEIGSSYKVSLNTFDGRAYESTFEELVPVPSDHQVTATLVQQEIVNGLNELALRDAFRFNIQANTAVESGDKARLLFNLSRTFKVTDDRQVACYVTDKIGVSTARVIDGNDFTGSVAETELYTEPINTLFSQGYTLSVYTESLSEGAHQFFEQISQLVDPSENLFQPPPGKVFTNFSNINDPKDNVYGYFYCTEQDTSRIFVDSLMAGEPMKLCPPTAPPPPGGGCAVQLCCDCEVVSNSTSQKPEFWIK